MFSVIRAHQLKALNFQLPTYVSEDQNGLCLPVCVQKKVFPFSSSTTQVPTLYSASAHKKAGIRFHGPEIYVH